MSVRAKFVCRSESTVRFGPNHDPQRQYEFTAVCDNDTPENERYAKYTPVGHLTMTVDNPAVSFEPGAYYYLDFTPVE